MGTADASRELGETLLSRFFLMGGGSEKKFLFSLSVFFLPSVLFHDLCQLQNCEIRSRRDCLNVKPPDKFKRVASECLRARAAQKFNTVSGEFAFFFFCFLTLQVLLPVLLQGLFG